MHSLETLGGLHYLICTTLSIDVVIIGLFLSFCLD